MALRLVFGVGVGKAQRNGVEFVGDALERIDHAGIEMPAAPRR